MKRIVEAAIQKVIVARVHKGQPSVILLQSLYQYHTSTVPRCSLYTQWEWTGMECPLTLNLATKIHY